MPSKPTIPRVCRQCGSDFFTWPSKIRQGGGLYCDGPCYYASIRNGRRSGDVIVQDDGTALVPLCGRNGKVRTHAIIDAIDAVFVSQWRWSLDSNGYARRVEVVGKGKGAKRLTFKLHRELLGLTRGDGLEGDHRDLNRLNNRRNNLRIVPQGSQPQNQPSHAGSSSSYRGVSWDAGNRKWKAEITVRGERMYLGLFEHESDAGEAARIARERLMPYALS